MCWTVLISLCNFNIISWVEPLLPTAQYSSAPALVVLFLDLQEYLTWHRTEQNSVQLWTYNMVKLMLIKAKIQLML